MFSRTLALEASRHGIRVNAITPSIVKDTSAYKRVMSSEFSQRLFAKAEAKAKLGVATPADIAPLAVFLAGPGAAKITGQAISVNGGISAA
jgi:NAD(P)-dependent dehydrogenase (short-subunit alcohol dehydrogenase family)